MSWKLIPVGASAAALIALAVFAAEKVERDAAARGPQTPAIAVLPFANIGRPEGQAQDFADGMTEEITSRLSSLRGVRVIGRQSVRGYARGNHTPAQAGTELGALYVLTGTVRWERAPDGSHVARVSPALIRTDSAAQLWAETFQTSYPAAFDVQTRIATEVADVMKLRLSSRERDALESKPTTSGEAYTLYMRGKESFENTSQISQIRAALSMFEKATKLDSTFVGAWAYLSMSHSNLFWFGADPTDARLALARAALDKAAALDATNPDVHFARGLYLYRLRNFDGALNEFATTLKLRPSDTRVPLYRGAIERRLGKWEEAVQSFRHGLDIAPRNGSSALGLASTLVFLGRYREAEQHVDNVMSLAPTEWNGPRLKSRIAIDLRGNVPEAIQHMHNALRTVQPPSALTNLLLTNLWPAIENPALRRVMVATPYSPDMDKGWYYTTRAEMMRYAGENAKANAYADSAIATLEAAMPTAAEPSGMLMNLATANAIRGNPRAALDAYERAQKALPPSLDAFVAPDRENAYVMLLVYLGDYDSAVAAMEKRVGVPGGMSRNYLRLNPLFMPLRVKPRFERLIQNP